MRRKSASIQYHPSDTPVELLKKLCENDIQFKFFARSVAGDDRYFEVFYIMPSESVTRLAVWPCPSAHMTDEELLIHLFVRRGIFRLQEGQVVRADEIRNFMTYHQVEFKVDEIDATKRELTQTQTARAAPSSPSSPSPRASTAPPTPCEKPDTVSVSAIQQQGLYAPTRSVTDKQPPAGKDDNCCCLKWIMSLMSAP